MLAIMATATLLGQQHSRGDAAAEVAVNGDYTSAKYGYSVRLPDGIVGLRPAAPAPQHGFGATLPNGLERYVWVNAEYDVLMLGDSVRAAQDASARLSTLYGVSVVASSKRELSGLDAQDVTLVNQAGAGSVNYIHLLVAYRAVAGEVGVIYTLGLREKTRSRKAETLFAALTESFKTRDISDRARR